MESAISSLRIRKFEPTDLNRVLEIQTQAYELALREGAESFMAKHHASPASFWVAQSEEKILGYLIALPCVIGQPVALNECAKSSEEAADGLHLHDLAVASEARGRGVAQKLVHQFYQTLADSPFTRASLVAVQASAPFWSKQGFQATTLDAKAAPSLRDYGQQACYMIYSVPHE